MIPLTRQSNLGISGDYISCCFTYSVLCVTEQTRHVYEKKLMRLLNPDGSMMHDHSDDYDDSDEEDEDEDVDGADLQGGSDCMFS